MGTICEYELDKSIEEHKWKIKILKTKSKEIMIGVAPIDFDIHSSSYNTCGWYFYCHNSCKSLYSLRYFYIVKMILLKYQNVNRLIILSIPN